jgi:hypothetical protein
MATAIILKARERVLSGRFAGRFPLAISPLPGACTLGLMLFNRD